MSRPRCREQHDRLRHPPRTEKTRDHEADDDRAYDVEQLELPPGDPDVQNASHTFLLSRAADSGFTLLCDRFDYGKTLPDSSLSCAKH